MTFIDWFSGIGGFRCGLERAGLGPCVAHSEIDDYAEKVYQKHWPGSRNLRDIRNVQPSDIPDAELWCGGFPCQPFSVAGKRKGAADERNLWPVWMDLIRICRPQILFGENVPGLLADPQFGQILSDLSTAGYRVEWSVIGAYEVGAPHKRDRLWIVAANGNGEGRPFVQGQCSAASAPGTAEPESDARWQSEPSIRRVDDGVRPRIHGHRVRCLGNAVVPQVVEWIGRRILAAG